LHYRQIDNQVEIVPISANSILELKEKFYYTYKIEIPLTILRKFENPESAFYHVNALVRNKTGYSGLLPINGDFHIISPKKIHDLFIDTPYSDNNIIELIDDDPIQLDLIKNFELIRTFFYQTQQLKFSDSDIQYDSYSLIDKRSDLIKSHFFNTQSKLRKFAEYIHLYGGFTLVLRKYGQDIYVQISPKTSLRFDADLNILTNEFSEEEIVNVFDSFSLPINRSGKLFRFENKIASEPIHEKPFYDHSFLEFAQKQYPSLKFVNENAKIISILPFGNMSRPWYFTSEKVVPRITFQDMASWDRTFHRKIISQTKYYSSKREEHIYSYLNENLFSLDDIELITEKKLLTLKGKSDYISPNMVNKVLNTFIIKHPVVQFLDKIENDIVDIRRDGRRYRASPVDILNNDHLTCFVSPDEINVISFYQKGYKKSSDFMIKNLESTFPHYFNTKINCSDNIKIDDLSESYGKFSHLSNEFDCVLVFGPRFVEGDSIKTRKTYTVPETQILNQGIPAQFISDNPRGNQEIGKNIEWKAKNSNTLFGIGLNIISKIGTKIMGFSEDTFSQFLPSSVVLGYDVIRIYKEIDKNISQNESYRKLISESTPLAAPIVLMSDDGNDLIIQNVYELKEHTALFREQIGEDIISNIPRRYKNLIIHKEGNFFEEELLDLKTHLSDNLRIIPISIICGNSPRIFSSLYQTRRPEPGTTLSLSSRDFVMATPLSNIQESGWPNSITIKIHDLEIGHELTHNEINSLLYQIFSLTRIHQASQIPTRRPISIHYSKIMGTFLRKCRDPNPEYFKHFIRKRNRHGYIPKIFL